jgi:ATP-dependent RNA helicase DDX24/MAK5
LATGTPLRIASIVGGLSHVKQARLLRGHPDVVVATPGRLWDLASGGDANGGASLAQLNYLQVRV